MKITFGIISVLLGVLLVLQWNNAHQSYSVNENRLESNARVDQYLDEHFIKTEGLDATSLHKSSIGILIESLEFSSENDLEMSGHIWQKINMADKESISKALSSLMRLAESPLSSVTPTLTMITKCMAGTLRPIYANHLHTVITLFVARLYRLRLSRLGSALSRF